MAICEKKKKKRKNITFNSKRYYLLTVLRVRNTKGHSLSHIWVRQQHRIHFDW